MDDLLGASATTTISCSLELARVPGDDAGGEVAWALWAGAAEVDASSAAVSPARNEYVARMGVHSPGNAQRLSSRRFFDDRAGERPLALVMFRVHPTPDGH